MLFLSNRYIVAIGLVLFLVLAPINSLATKEKRTIIYPAHESKQDKRFQRFIDLLDMALARTREQFGDFQLKPSASVMTEARFLAQLELETGKIDVAWSATNLKKEKALAPVRIPIVKGLLGYRLSLIHEDSQVKLSKIKTTEDLKKVSIGQGIGWGDVEIYNSNGYGVTTALYENLYRMLVQKRFEIFPRGINEAFTEYEIRKKNYPKLAIEQQFVLYYKYPFYFFTSKKNKNLAKRIEIGLELMIADGSFDTYFEQTNGEAIRRAKLANRTMIILNNELLPKETPFDRKELWFTP